MTNAVKRIGVLTSGGDAPGMNAAIRAVVRSAIYRGIDCVGIRRGFNGLINGDFVRLDENSVNHIINRGGTMLYTARSEEFRTVEGQQRAAATCKLLGLDGIVGIGGDGTFRGLKEFSSRASASSAFRQPLITISSAPTTPSATTPRPTPPSRLSTVSETPCSRTSAALSSRSWAETRAIWRSMSVWRRAQRPYLCRKRSSILSTT